MRWIVRKGLRAPRVMLGIAVLLIVAGVAQIRSAPVDVLPEFQPPTVEVQTEALGLSAAEVEEFITVPLEQDLLNGVAFLDEIRSASIAGLSSIEMIFEPGTDLLSARQVVQERLAQAQGALPNVQTRPSQMLQPLSSTSRVMMIGVSSDQLSPIDLSLQMRWTVGPKLLGVPGVANVAVWGSRERQLQVLVDPARLRQQGTSLQEVIDATANAQFVCPLTFEECSTPGTGGIIETANQRVGVQYVPVTATPEKLAGVPVEGSAGPITLGDVATLTEDHQQLIGDAVGPDLLVVVQKFPDANTLQVTSGLTDALETLRPGLADVRFDTSIYRPATYIETSSSNLITALVIGGVLAAVALALLLSGWRRIVIAVVAMATSLGAAAAVLTWTDASLNWMTIAGLVLGLVVVVDEAVVALSGTTLDRRERGTGDAPRLRRELLDATLRARGPAAYALLITGACLVPAFFAEGTFGTFFPSIAVPFAIAAAVAMGVSLVITPSLTWLIGTGPAGTGSLVDRYIASPAARGIGATIRTPLVAAIVGGAVLLAGLASLLTLDRSMVPTFKDENLLVHLSGAPSTSLTEMQRVAGRVADELRTVTGVANAGAHVGRAITSDQTVGTNAGQVWVTLDPDADYDATVSTIQGVVGGYPGLGSDVVTYPNARIDEILPAADAPVVVRLYGQGFDVLQAEGEEIRSLLTRIDGIAEPRVVVQPREPTLEIEVDLALAQEHGIRPGDVRRAASALISGITVGSLFEDQKVFEVVVWGEPEIRSDLSAVDGLLIETPDGDPVRLGDVADVRIAPSPTAIQHESVSRYTDIVANVEGRSVGDVLGDIEAELRLLELPLEYHAEVLDAAGTDGGSQRLWILATAAAVLTFLLLQAAVASWRLAGISLVVLVLVLAGGLAAAAVAGGTASLGTAAGLAVCLTIGARQVLAMMTAYRAHVRDGAPVSDESIIDATGTQIAPTVSTLVVGSLLLLPIAVAGPIAGLEIVQPMAVVAIGGLAASAVACLVVLPGLYRRLGDTPSDDTEDLSMDALVDLVQHETLEPIGGGS